MNNEGVYLVLGYYKGSFCPQIICNPKDSDKEINDRANRCPDYRTIRIYRNVSMEFATEATELAFSAKAKIPEDVLLKKLDQLESEMKKQ